MEVGQVADEELGTVALTPTARLVFAISHWKGQQRAHVRKFVLSGKFTGPTPSGFVLTGEVLLEIIGALRALQTALPGVEGQEYARISKRGGVDFVVSTVSPDAMRGLPSVDIREYVESSTYTGPTKKGVRFPWEKLPEVIALLQIQAQRLGANKDKEPRLFPEAKPAWVEQAAKVSDSIPSNRDEILSGVLPDGAKKFPADFMDPPETNTQSVELPVELVSVTQMPDGKWAVKSTLGFCHPVRNPTEGNFIYYAHLRGDRTIRVPFEMIDIFRTVKKYENYLRELRQALMQAYERKSGHRPMAEHHTREVFRTMGLPWPD
jgi:Transcriptional Coactivator p15 (PC4)